MSNRRRHTGSRANPDPNTCLGVFGLSLYTTERDLREVFSRYGPLSGVNVVYDQRTGRSRGFAFVYFERIDDSKEAMERANGMELDGRRIRVDYSITKRAHTPTPGIYMGIVCRSSFAAQFLGHRLLSPQRQDESRARPSAEVFLISLGCGKSG